MPLLEVACPGCQAVLKAPDTMAGKKARCKRCNTSFRIPGAALADSVGDSQQLSVADPPPAPKKPAPPPADDIPAATAVDDDEPFPASVAEDDALPAVPDAPADPFAFSAAPAKKGKAPRAEDPPPPADAGDPFSFSPGAPEPKKGRKPAAAAAADADDERPAARKKPAGGGGLVKVIVAATVFAVVVGGIVAGVLVYLNNTKPGEQAKGEKKEEKKLDPPPNEPAPAPVGKTEPTAKEKEPAKGNKGTAPVAKTPKGKGGAMLTLAPGKPLTFPPKVAAQKVFAAPEPNPIPVGVPFAELRRFFPPSGRDTDVGVAWRSAAGFQGAGEKVALSLFSAAGTETAKVETDGDGGPDPACDLSADTGTFVYGHRLSSKLTVWDVRKKTKKLDAFDPYADKPEHKAAKLGAVYLMHPPDRVVTVTTAGAVHVWDVATKAMVGEYVPPKTSPAKVVPGRSAAVTANRQGVVVAVGGAVYLVNAVGAVDGATLADLGGDVGKSLALAASPAGRVVYAFETDADGKKERAVAHLSAGKVGPILRLPADAGEPTAAGWADDRVAAVAFGSGSVVFDAEDGFRLQAVVRVADDKAAPGVAESSLWGLLPAPNDPKRCVAVGVVLPLPGGNDLITPANQRPAAALVMDLKGLSQ